MGNFNWNDSSKEAKSGGGEYILLPIGDYDGVIFETENATSSSGMPMFKCTIGFKTPDGVGRVFENITQDWAMDQLAAAAGLPLNTPYSRFQKMLVGKQIKAHLKQDTYKEQTMNRIAYYILPQRKDNDDEF